MDALLRRRAMMAGGVEPPPPPIPMPTPDYELASPTTTAGYNTGVKLFDTAKSFTILCEASFNNYSWTQWTQGLFGTVAGTKNLNFKLGSIDTGNDYQNGVVSATANRYTAIVLNKTQSNRRCSSLLPRSNTTQTKKFFVRYDHTTRKVEAGTYAPPTANYYTTDGDYISTQELQLLIGGAAGTVSIFKVYLQLLTDEQIGTFFA